MKLTTSWIALTVVACFGMLGCQEPADSTTGDPPPVSDLPPATVDDHAGHNHPTEGPHGGDLIELGNEEYHAELIHPHDHDDDAHENENHAEDEPDHDHAGITIYVLDGSAKEMVAIESPDVTLNIKHGDQPEQFKLAAKPTDEDPEGKSSRFVSDDKDLMEHFHEEEIEGTLVLQINGKSYRGKIAHDHEHGHEGHKH